MSHRLNLAIGDACKILIIVNVIDKMKKINNFFNKSPKKKPYWNTYIKIELSKYQESFIRTVQNPLKRA